MDNSFKSIIDGAKSILILLPTKPYFDQVAAGLSLYLAVRDQKDIQVACPSPMTVEFNRLIGINKITQEIGNKNLVIEFSDYKANDIERVSYDIIDGKFRLTVIPKLEVSAPTKDQVQLNYSGVSADTVILVGGANETHFPALSSKDLTGAKIIHIGTRDLAMGSNKEVISIARPSSSVSEIVSFLIAESGLSMDEDIATNLIMGIEEATANFTGSGVGPDTFEIVAQLMRSGGRRGGGQVQTQQYPQGAIPGQMPVQPIQPAQPVQPVQSVQSAPSQQAPQSTNSGQTIDKTQDEGFEETPTDWLKPKIYKGTTVS